MAGEDGFIRIGTKIDEEGLDKGLDSVDKKLNSTTKGTKDFAAGLAKAGLAAAGVVAAVKAAGAVVDDLTDAYRTQFKAETQLAAAAKNNPYLDKAAVQRLRDYATELGRVAGVGDEELLPFMAQLAAAGRTEKQVQEVMAAALDIAASGTMSLDSAVRSLNKSYGGLAGELGESIPEIKDMTAEQLKNGGAVKLLGERYKGMAAEVAGNVGSGNKLKAAFTDLKETLGQPFERAIAPAREFFAALIQGWADARKKKQEYDDAAKSALMDQNVAPKTFLETWEKSYGKNAGKEAKNILSILTGGLNAAGSNLKEIRDLFAAAESELGLSTEKIIALNDAYGIFNSQTNVAIEQLRKEVKTREDARRAVQASLEAARKAQAERDAAEAKSKEADDKAKLHIKAVTDEREKAIQQIQLQAKAENREADQLEIINAYVASYVKLVSESGGLISSNNSAAKELLATIQHMASAYDQVLAAQESSAAAQADRLAKTQELIDRVRGSLDAIDDAAVSSDQMKTQIEQLDQFQAAVLESDQILFGEKYALQEEYNRKRGILLKQIEAAEKEEADAELKNRYEKTQKALEIANTFAQQYQQIMSSLQSFVTQQIETEATAKTAELQKQYEEGKISAEDYEKGLTDIKRDAAKEKYKIDMWAWGANIAAAIANTALAATKALADGGGWLGAVLAASIIALGGIQVATLAANKPIPPSFTTGGVVGGTSYTGDKVKALVNSGEMMLNSGQQRNLFDRINNGDLGSSGPKVQVYNSAANIVKAEPEVNEDGIRIAIRQIVSKDMGEGKFNDPFRKMQQNIRGTRYTN